MATHSPLQRLPAKLSPPSYLCEVCPRAPVTVLLKKLSPFVFRVRHYRTTPIVPDFCKFGRALMQHIWRRGSGSGTTLVREITLCYHFSKAAAFCADLLWDCLRRRLPMHAESSCWSGLFLRISETLQSGRCHTHCSSLGPFVFSFQRELLFLWGGGLPDPRIFFKRQTA